MAGYQIVGGELSERGHLAHLATSIMIDLF
jgi:hypothetical protein